MFNRIECCRCIFFCCFCLSCFLFCGFFISFCIVVCTSFHNVFKVDFTCYTRNSNLPVFKNLRMNFTEHTALLAVYNDCSLTSRNKARIFTFLNFILMIKIIKNCAYFRSCIVKICVVACSQKSEGLNCFCSCIFTRLDKCNFSNFKNFVRIYSVSTLSFCFKQRCNN